MLTDAIDYDYRKHGVRREGVYTAFYSFVEKLAGAFGPLMVGLLLSAAGFNRDLPPKAAQSPEVVAALLLGMAAIPALSSALAASIIWFFRLDQAKLEQVTREDAAPAPSLSASRRFHERPAMPFLLTPFESRIRPGPRRCASIARKELRRPRRADTETLPCASSGARSGDSSARPR